MDWPILWSYGPSTNAGQGSETYYHLPAIIAERWQRARER
jgi:hypothetical protein